MLCPSLCERRIFEHPPEGRTAEAGEPRGAPAAAAGRPAPSRGGSGFAGLGGVRAGFPRLPAYLPAASRCVFRGRATTATGPAGLPERPPRRGEHRTDSCKIKPSPADPRLPQPCLNFSLNILIFPSLISALQPGAAGSHPCPAGLGTLRVGFRG